MIKRKRSKLAFESMVLVLLEGLASFEDLIAYVWGLLKSFDDCKPNDYKLCLQAQVEGKYLFVFFNRAALSD